MAKNKFGKLLILGALAGAAAAGVYHYLQSKDRELDDFDDFDDFRKNKSNKKTMSRRHEKYKDANLMDIVYDDEY